MSDPCIVCGKPSNRLHWMVVDGDRLARCCSPRCIDYHTTREPPVTDPTKSETEAMGHASDMAGEYLESLGKTDMATMSLEEWMTLIQVVCGGYSERLVEIAAREFNTRPLRAKAPVKVSARDIPY